MKKSYIIPFVFLILIGIASASITISQSASIYNLGDTIHITITINPSIVEGNFEGKLICGNSSETFYKISPAKSAFTANQEIKINHKIIIERQYIGNMTGECRIIASLGSITTQTERFRISSDIIVNAILNKEFYDPGEVIVLDIDAVKANGQRLNGFVKSEGLFNFEKQITEGKLREILTTEKNLEAGEYKMDLFIFEENKDKEILNFKNITVGLRINQIAYSVPITLPSLEINPGTDFEFKAELFDQSGKKMHGIVTIEFFSPLRERILLSVESGNSEVVSFPRNATPGTWALYSSHGRLKEERKIKVNSVPLLEYNFIEGSSVLLITNIGNADYVGIVQVAIGEENRNLTLDIKPGEERKFTLYAPTGEHDVKIGNEENMVEKRLLLTGNAVAIKDYGRFFVFSKYPAIWSIITTIIILLGIVTFFRYNKKTFNLNKKIKTKIESIKNVKSDYSGRKMFEESKNSKVSVAEASLVIKGLREPSSIITIKIKNELKPFIKENFEKIIFGLTEKNNATVDFKEKEVFIIFSPRKTRTYKNEYSAIKMALEINSALQESNKKFHEKVDFGIGVNSGDLISTMEKDKLKYTGVGNTISSSKKIANMSNQEVLISERVKNKLLREVRSEKIEKSGSTYYKVLKISERADNREKLKDLLKRTHMD